MPIPKPAADESRKAFVARCLADSNMQEYRQTQRAAICIGQWGDAPLSEVGAKPKGKYGKAGSLGAAKP